MSGWYVAAALYVLGWIFSANAAIDFRASNSLTSWPDRHWRIWAVVVMAFWPAVTVIWFLAKGWQPSSWRASP